MTCRRLEDSELLGELLGERPGPRPGPHGDGLDDHVVQCPDCSARLHGYRRIAGWIADGKTMHRPSADWQRRTLAHVLASSNSQPAAGPATRTEPVADLEVSSARRATTGEPARGIAAVADVRAGDPGELRASRAMSPIALLSGSVRDREQASPARPRRQLSRTAVLAAAAAIVVAVASVALLDGDPQPPRIAAGGAAKRADGPTDHDAHGPTEALTRKQPEPASPVAGAGGSGQERATSSSQPARVVPPALPAPRGTKPSGPPQRPQPAEPVVRSSKRGGAPIVDWLSEPDEEVEIDLPAIGARKSMGTASGAAGPLAGEPGGSAAVAPRDPVVESQGLRTVLCVPMTSHGLSSSEINDVVAARAGVFRACHDKASRQPPGTRCRLAVSFEIAGDGTVHAVDRSGSVASCNAAVTDCVMAEVRQLGFPANRGVAEVTCAFELAQRDR